MRQKILGFEMYDNKECHICSRDTMNYCFNCRRGVCLSHSKRIEINAGMQAVVCSSCLSEVKARGKIGRINPVSIIRKDHGW